MKTKNLVHDSVCGPKLILKYVAKEVKKWDFQVGYGVDLCSFIRRIIQNPFTSLTLR